VHAIQSVARRRGLQMERLLNKENACAPPRRSSVCFVARFVRFP
jgi:hypothetical protein